MERLGREKEELESDRKRLVQQVVEKEQCLLERERDLELKDVKIQSLESILQKRDISLDFSSNNMSKYEDKLKQLENDREKLIKDNVTLIRESEMLKD